MKYETYAQLRAADDFSIFYFVSSGKNGSILKRIEFMPMEQPDVYNLVFGDVNPDGEIHDCAISDNGDRNKVLSTVAYVAEQFINRYPFRSIYFRGSTPERTRLYRMAIGLNFEYLAQRFDIYSEQSNGIVPFQKNIETLGLLVRKKA